MWEESEEENNKKDMIILNRNKWKLFVIDELWCVTEQLAQQASAREAQEELKFVQTKAEKWRAKYYNSEAKLHGQAAQLSWAPNLLKRIA